MKRHLFPIIALIIFSILGMKALFHPGLYTAHDIWHQVARFYHYYHALLDGQFPPYWIANLSNGFGYPLFFFSYHLPWVIGYLFLFAGLDIPTTIKLLFFISYLFSGLFMYILAYNIFQNKYSAFISSFLYLWAPYHFSTIFVGAAMGTAFVFSFAPLIFLGIYKIGQREEKAGTIILSLGISGVLLSHLMSAISLLPLIILFTLWITYQKPSLTKGVFIKKVLISLVLGIGLCAFYLIPAVYYSRETQAGTGAFSSLYQKNFVNLSQLIYSHWGYGISDNAKAGVNSYQIGIAQWIAFFSVVIILLLRNRFQLIEKLDKNKKILSYVLVASFLLSVFLMIDSSKFLWDFAAKFVTLDYPTMFLLSATFTGSMLVGFLVNIVKSNLQKFVFLILLIIAIYTNRNHLRVNMYTDIPVSMYVSSEITTNSYHEYLPKTADITFFDSDNSFFVLPKTLMPENLKKTTKGFSFSLSSQGELNVTVNHFVFSGITLYIDNNKHEFATDPRGRIAFLLPSGNHFINVRFEETLLIKISKLATIVSLLYLLMIAKKIICQNVNQG